jgi:uncharacterized membrane protein YphA (DoxX/SURF4 family)
MKSVVNVVLWVLQVVLGLFFVLASGAPKFFAPHEMLAMPIDLPREFLIFVGTCEVLGGLGLILPGLLRRRQEMTTVAAFMLVLLTLCATVYQLLGRQPESAVFAVGVGVVCALIGYGRWKVAPLGRASARPAVRAALATAGA